MKKDRKSDSIRNTPKYGANSSIIITDYDVIRQKFKVIKRVEVPRSEYSYDAAVNTIVELNDIYNPSWIFCDRGSGENFYIVRHMNYHFRYGNNEVTTYFKGAA